MKLATIINYPVVNGFGPLGNAHTTKEAALSTFEKAISTAIGTITVMGGVWFTLQVIVGAYNWITAGSDKDAVQKAQKRFTNALIGLIVLVFSYTLIALVGNALGLNVLKVQTTIINVVG